MAASWRKDQGDIRVGDDIGGANVGSVEHRR
jgi:hypothetical protein